MKAQSKVLLAIATFSLCCALETKAMGPLTEAVVEIGPRAMGRFGVLVKHFSSSLLLTCEHNEKSLNERTAASDRRPLSPIRKSEDIFPNTSAAVVPSTYSCLKDKAADSLIEASSMWGQLARSNAPTGC